MKFAGNAFFMLSLASLMSLFQMDAMAGCNNLRPGSFCKGYSSHLCFPGCYCQGNTDKDIGALWVLQVKDACIAKTAKNRNILNSANIYYCPDDFPYSDSGKSSSDDCWGCEKGHYKSSNNRCSGTKLYNKSITCPFGKYLPKGSEKCADCTKDPNGNKYLCMGGTWKPSFDKDQGLSDFNASNTASVTLSVKCSTGQYLPADLATCATCPDGYICPNAKTYTVSSVDQGAEKCPTGTTPNANRTKCEQTANNTNTDNVKKWVNAGYYLPANSSEQRGCTTQKQYCPGGWFSKKNYDQGKYDCPYGEETSDHKSCHMKITQEQMRNGINGNSDCWLKINDSEDYKTCVFGKR